jgi:tyrosine-protein phosphatase YwqE
MALTFVTSVTHNTSVTPNMCHTVSQCDTMTQKSSKLLEKMQKNANFLLIKKKIEVSHYDTLTRI